MKINHSKYFHHRTPKIYTHSCTLNQPKTIYLLRKSSTKMIIKNNTFAKLRTISTLEDWNDRSQSKTRRLLNISDLSCDGDDHFINHATPVWNNSSTDDDDDEDDDVSKIVTITINFFESTGGAKSINRTTSSNNSTDEIYRQIKQQYG